MKATIKIQNKVLSDLIFNTLKTYFNNYTITQKNEEIVVINNLKQTITISIVKDEIIINTPQFKYNNQLITLLFWVVVLPLNIAGFLFSSFIVSLLQFFLPSAFVLSIIYYKTRKTQYNTYLQLLAFHNQIESCILKAYSKSIV